MGVLEVVEFDAQRFAATKVIQERVVRLLGLLLVVLCQVDKIGPVRQNVPMMR